LNHTPAVTELVICADDYAMTPEISAGIIALAEQGRISATSAMTLSPHWPVWARQVRSLQTRIDVGLHLDWTSDFALRQGFGRPLGKLMVQSLLGAMDKTQVRAQIQSQLDLFESHAGSAPDHIDGHQHVQQFPVLREALIEVLLERYPAHARPWLRVSHVVCPPWALKARIINGMGAQALRGLAQQHGLPHSEHLSGIYDFSGDAKRYHRHLQQWLRQRTAGTVLMCHPAQGLNVQAPFPQARVQEQQVLGDPELAHWLHQHAVRIVRGRTLFGTNPSQTA